jgi:hypothetical protein
MKIIKESRISAMSELLKLKNNRNPEMKDNLDYQMDHLDKLMKIRGKLLINKEFTEEEYFNTLDYVNLLRNEEYEKMTNFKIIKDLK